MWLFTDKGVVRGEKGQGKGGKGGTGILVLPRPLEQLERICENNGCPLVRLVLITVIGEDDLVRATIGDGETHLDL